MYSLSNNKLLSDKNIHLHVKSEEIKTISCFIYKERYGLYEIVYQALMEPIKQKVKISLNYEFLLEHKNWSYCIKGRANNKTLYEIKGEVTELLKIENDSLISFPLSIPQAIQKLEF